MIESFVDLTYRGLSLGRRIKLTQVRPRSGFLELASPMPVGTYVVIAADDGVTFDATVSWVHEQVAGSDRTPGMVVVPAIVADPAASWWQARVTLPDEDKPATRFPPSRPVTVRPPSRTESALPAEETRSQASPEEGANLQARDWAAAGQGPPTSSDPPASSDPPGDRRTTAMHPGGESEPGTGGGPGPTANGDRDHGDGGDAGGDGEDGKAGKAGDRGESDDGSAT
ncbi:MAG TPA: hypothetical protein VHN14_14230 [Kofleriaceae bacterium]|nr:hypothetical protein [Kofleriaceae bacterium]